MTRSPASPSESHVVLSLRAAGCVFAEEEAALLIAAANSPLELETALSRRIAGEPLEVILGWAQFAGLRIAIDPRVFVPRRRTEFLVRQAVRLARPDALVVDLCCGSGALGAAMAKAVPGIRLLASDIDPAAVTCARRNLGGLGAVYQGDLFDALPASARGRVDLLLVNAPYVPTAELAGMPREARDYEPQITLDGGADGLDVHRRVAEDAPTWLAPGGTLLIETSEQQASAASVIFEKVGLMPRVVRSQKRRATVVMGTVVMGTVALGTRP
jgi:release factor glutamine methyltransferase